ncbi:MAG: hypothetical protein A2297_03770 [Elusimicrobia bacterium RIFOXYB2_FULL_48_7]|nr:MAG: hypothetical protein A2297_03770 [Elusimicrobia bacterium RIFOXYB2_FULL_48_7]
MNKYTGLLRAFIALSGAVMLFPAGLCLADEVWTKDGMIRKGLIAKFSNDYLVLGGSATWDRISYPDVELVRKDDSLFVQDYRPRAGSGTMINFIFEGIAGDDPCEVFRDKGSTQSSGYGAELQFVKRNTNFGIGIEFSRTTVNNGRSSTVNRNNTALKFYMNPQGVFNPWIGLGGQNFFGSYTGYRYEYNYYYPYSSVSRQVVNFQGAADTVCAGFDLNFAKEAFISLGYTVPYNNYSDSSVRTGAKQTMIKFGFKLNLMSD